MPLPDPIEEVLTVCATIMYRPDVEETDDVVNRNAVFARTPHGRSSRCRASGNAQAPNWRARWSPLAVSRQLLLLIVETFVPAGASVDLVIDETLERRWGGKIEPPRPLP